MGIVTARDALKLTLPRQEHPQINIANTSDNDIRGTIEDHVGRYLRKMHGTHKISNQFLYTLTSIKPVNIFEMKTNFQNSRY